MYNEKRKSDFIGFYTGSLKTKQVAATIFNAMEKYEVAWGADLCTRSEEELQPAVDEIVGIRTRSKWMTLIILKEYVKWCLAMRVPGACDGMLRITTVGLDKMKRQMVSGPLHLQKFLDDIFTPESDETVDNLYRCYFWMAFGGVDEEDSIQIKSDQVDFGRMVIRHKGEEFPIYREAVPAFRNAVELTSFLHRHTEPVYEVRLDRVQGDTILRSVRSQVRVKSIRIAILKRINAMQAQGATIQKLSYDRLRLSGLFYRAYERERLGETIDFRDEVDRRMQKRIDGGKSYAFDERGGETSFKNRKNSSYLEDYLRWKAAFAY